MTAPTRTADASRGERPKGAREEGIEVRAAGARNPTEDRTADDQRAHRPGSTCEPGRWEALAGATIDLHRARSSTDLVSKARSAARLVIQAASIDVVLTTRAADTPEAGRSLDALSALPAIVEARGTAVDAWRDAIAAAGLPAPAAAWLGVPLRGSDGVLLGVLHAVDGPGQPGLAVDDAGVQHLARAVISALEAQLVLRAAQRASRARDELIGMVSHDLRNPLNTIAMGLTLLERAPEVAPHGQVLARLRRGTTRLNRLIGDLLDVTRIEAGTLTVDPAPLSPAVVVEEVVDLLAAQAAEKNLRVEVSVPPHAPMLLADRDRLVQVLMNLLGNAIKFTPPKGVVAVSAARHGDVLRFEVRDTGPGIAQKDVPHVFDRFWQARSTASQGTGLGLFIAKGIVQAHGGTMHVESDEGLGTCVAFSLSVAPDADRSNRKTEPGSQGHPEPALLAG